MCGILSIFDHPDAVALMLRGMSYLQHRGPNGAGISAFYNGVHDCIKGPGLVDEVLPPDVVTKRLKGRKALCHTRYATTTDVNSMQPLFAEIEQAQVALAHNGNIPFAESIREKMKADHHWFLTNLDTELILHLICESKAVSLVGKIKDGLKSLKGAYSLVLLSDQEMIGLRDPKGFRPLIIGVLDGAYLFASETCALDTIGATFVRNVEPGEIVRITSAGIESHHFDSIENCARCIFEPVYFTRPDSIQTDNAERGARSFSTLRFELGKRLADQQRANFKLDIITGIPDSGTPAGEGFAFGMGMPHRNAIIRNHASGRTFLATNKALREEKVRVKFNVVKDLVRGKRWGLVDDSLVRGTTSKTTVAQFWEAKPAEIHLFIPCPRVISTCHHGINLSTMGELLAVGRSIEEMRQFLNVTSLTFLPLADLHEIVGGNGHCDGCFSQHYPEEVPTAA